jgi:antitoxin (DNA-binding transcriptional repressor) of toxin-antitoxin stability system
MGCMQNHTIHVSDTEAARDFKSLLEQVRAGAEVVIEKDACPIAVLRAAGSEGSISEIFSGIGQDISLEDWSRVPSDLSKNLDHYLYGTAKSSR